MKKRGITLLWLQRSICVTILLTACAAFAQGSGGCLQVQCQPDKTVPCGSNWSFDTPVATSCCTNQFVTSTGVATNVLITSTGIVTNGSCPQPITVTETWSIQDGCGDTNTCSQTVTLVGCCTNDCCGPNVGPQSIQWLQLPTNTTRLLPDPSSANTGGTWIITNLPGYGRVLITQDAPTNVLVVLTNADFGAYHAGSSFDNVPTNSGSFEFTEYQYGPYSWGVLPGSVALAYAFPSSGGSLPSYQVSFYFLDGQPNACQLVLATIGLAQFTTNTISQPVTFRSEYDLVYDPVNYPSGPSAYTVLNGLFGPPISGATGNVVSSGFDPGTNYGDPWNTGYALFQPASTLATTPLPPGSGFDINADPYPSSSAPVPYLTVTVNHQPHDIFSLAVGYLCCSNCPTNCLQIQGSTNKVVQCGASWQFDPPTATTCCTNQIITSTGVATNVLITVISTVTNGACPNPTQITQTWSIIDACGDSNTWSQTVSVVGCCSNCLQVFCPSNKSVQCGSQWAFDPPQAGTCCTNQIIFPDGTASYILITPVSTVTNGSCPQPITVTQTWLIADGCGNSNYCSQTVTLVGCCSNCLNVQCATNKTVPCGTTWSFDAPTATTCCASNFPGTTTNLQITVSSTVTNGTCPKIATRVWTITDACGDSETCTQKVTIVDTTPPVILCPTHPLIVALNSNCDVVIPHVSVTASDNCTPPCSLVYSQSPPAGTVVFGTNATVTVTVTDLCGNSNSCSVTVIGEPLLPPIVTCPATMDVTNCVVPCVPVVARSICCRFSPTVTQSPPCNTPLGPGMNTVTITATDCHGNVTIKIVHLNIIGGGGPASFLSYLTNSGAVSPSGSLSPVLYPDGVQDVPWAAIGMTTSGLCGPMPADYLTYPVVVSTACHAVSGNCPFPCAAGGFEYVVWGGPASTASKWMAPNYTNNECDPCGSFSYTLQFMLPPNIVASTATVSGRFAVDDAVTGLGVNGNAVPPPPPGSWGNWTPFTIAPNPYFITGQNAITFIVTNAVFWTGLRVEFTNAYGNCALCAPPYIQIISPGQILPAGSSPTFSVIVGGTPPFTYQWYHNNNPIAGAILPTLSLNNISLASGGIYSVVVSNSCGVTTGYVRLTVTHFLPWPTGVWNVSALAKPLHADVGPDLTLAGPNEALNYAIDAGSTDDYGLPNPAGRPVNVMHINPQLGMSLQIPQITASGSTSDDSYTVLMDLYEPGSSAGMPATLFSTPYVTNLTSGGQDGLSLTLDSSNYLNLSGSIAGVPFSTQSQWPMSVDTWNRVALVINNPMNGDNVTAAAYINGLPNITNINICTCCIATFTNISLNWANGSPTLLTAPSGSANPDLYVADLQFHAVALTPDMIAGIGSASVGPVPSSISMPETAPALVATVSNGVVTVSWSGDGYVLQECSDLESEDWTESTMAFTEIQQGSGTTTSATAKPSPQAPAKFYRLVFRP